MKNEVDHATEFLLTLLRARGVKLATLKKFQHWMINNLTKHYHNHWFEDQPFRGSGYRCIRINPKMMDPILEATWADCEPEDKLENVLPQELTLWVDPNEVSYRIGENGSIGVLYSGEHRKVQTISSLKQQQQYHQLQHQKQFQQRQQPHHLHDQQQPLQHSFYTGSCKREINKITMENQVRQMPAFS